MKKPITPAQGRICRLAHHGLYVEARKLIPLVRRLLAENRRLRKALGR